MPRTSTKNTAGNAMPKPKRETSPSKGPIDEPSKPQTTHITYSTTAVPM